MIGCVINPLFLFLAVWGTAGGLYVAGVLSGLFPTPHPLTVGALLVNLIAFPLGYMTWSLLQDLPSQALELPRLEARPLTTRRMQRALAFTLLMGVAALALMLYRLVAIAGYFNTGVLDLLTQPSRLRLGLIIFLERAVSETSLLVKLISLTSGFFAIGFVMLGVFLHRDRTPRKYVYLLGFLLVGFATCLMNLSRYDMTVSILSLILAYGVVSSSAGGEKPRGVTRDLLPPAVAVVVIFIAVELLLRKRTTYHQAGSLRGVLFSFYWYLASPIAAFNEFLGGFQEHFGLGQKTFLPFYKWLSRLDLVAEPQISVFGEFLHIPYPANVYTYLRSFYEDFGLLGVALVPYGLGWLLAALKNRAPRGFPFLNVYVFLLVPVIFSFYSYPLLSTQFYLQILFGFAFFRYEILDESRVEPQTAPQSALLYSR